HIKGDFFGGITAGIVALPLALAFGVSSGLGASAGLYGAIFIGFFAALFGGTNTQISGPTAPMTAVSMVIIAGIIASNDGDVARALPAILGVFLMAGILQIILGVIGLGKYIKYIPYPVVSGFMTAIGVIIIITQIIPSLGYNPKKDEAYVSQFKQHAEAAIVQNILKEEADEKIFVIEDYKQTVQRAEKITPAEIARESETLAAKESSGVLGAIKILPRALRNINWIEVLLTCCTILIIYGFKKITTKIPSALVALLVVSAVAYYSGINYIPIDTIPSGLPLPHLEIFSRFKFSDISPFVFSALSLALLGCIDSLLTSVVADNMTKTRHNPNKELIGQGIGNGVAAIFGGIPGAGATIRTVVNINAGGKTRLSGIMAAIFITFVLLALGPLASKVPAAVLSGILITVGIGVIDYKGLKAIPSMPRSEIVIMLIVLVLSSIWNLVYAVGIGLIIASMMFMKKIGDLTAKESLIQPLKEEIAWADEFDFPQNLKEEVFIKHINGPLFFGSTSDFNSLIAQIPSSASAIIIRMDNMSYIDQSGLYALEDAFVDLVKNGKKLLLVGIARQPKFMLERIKIIPDLIPANQVFTGFKDCLTWINQHVKQEYL
ncbi:MAG: SulP family inorganic anion transporter, partial [Ginsengibacter sp.]